MTSISVHPARRERGAREGRPATGVGWLGHAHIVPAFVVCLVVCAWFVTWGDWDFFHREAFCGFYDAQARAILHGRLDVPPSAIGFEAFNFRGRTYGYFAIGPALLRLPLVLLFNGMDGRWSRCMMLLACLINLVCAYRILLWARGGVARTGADKFLNSLFLLIAGIGSTNVFILNRSYTYHEAIMWGASFALLFTLALLSYFREPSPWTLAASGVCAFFSFHARATAGAGTLLILCVVTTVLLIRAMFFRNAGGNVFGLKATGHPWRHAFIAGGAVAIAVAVYLGVNYGKFRTFDGVPVRYYGLYHADPRRMQITGGRQIHPENIPTTVSTYFGLRGARFDASFPWIYLSEQPGVIGHPAIDVVEKYSSIPLSMPALALLALLGVVAVAGGGDEPLRQLRLPTLGLFLGGGIILMTVGITERYLHDLYPFLIVASAAGVARLATMKARQTMTSLLVILAVVSITLNCTFALEYQRLAVWGVPQAKHDEMVAVQQAVDGWVGRQYRAFGK